MSVHSVKAQTHCATMYIETSYYNYETQKLTVEFKKKTKTKPAKYHNNPLLQQEHNYIDTGCSRAKEAMKMMYVGFSRLTHLSCFAVLKGNLSDEQLSYFKSSDSSWSVIDLTEECNAPE